MPEPEAAPKHSRLLATILNPYIHFVIFGIFFVLFHLFAFNTWIFSELHLSEEMRELRAAVRPWALELREIPRVHREAHLPFSQSHSLRLHAVFTPCSPVTPHLMSKHYITSIS